MIKFIAMFLVIIFVVSVINMILTLMGVAVKFTMLPLKVFCDAILGVLGGCKNVIVYLIKKL